MTDDLTNEPTPDDGIKVRTPLLLGNRFPDDRPSSSTLRHPAVSLCESTDFLLLRHTDTPDRFQRVSGHLRGH
jgi:hypothetical protein